MNSPMLAVSAPIDLGKIKYPVAVEPKLDGVRCIAVKRDGVVTLYSRNMKKFNNFVELEQFCTQEMLDNTVWDGEIISDDFQKLMHRVHAHTGVNDDVPIEYAVFDALHIAEWDAGRSDRPYRTRKDDYVVANNESDLQTYYQELLKQGFEGAIIKNLDSPYISGKSNFWLKLKPSDTADLFIVGMIEGTGKHKGRLGALVCEYGKIKAKVGTGFTDAQRERMWESKDRLLGKMVEVEFLGLTKPNKHGNISLRHPSFKCLRLDKDN